MLKKFKSLSKVKKVIAVIAVLLLFSVIKNAFGTSTSACDCANLYENMRKERKQYSMRQINDGNFLRNEASKSVKKAKSCAIKYGNLTEMETTIANDVLQMNMIPNLRQAIDNAKKECATKKEYSNTELEMACDCWDQSVTKSGMAFDDMNSTQQQFRKKCFTVFDVEAAMKSACDNAK